MTIAHDMKDFNLAENTHKTLRRPATVAVGAARQLFFDDFFIAMGSRPDQYPRGIRWVNAPVENTAHPSLRARRPGRLPPPGCR